MKTRQEGNTDIRPRKEKKELKKFNVIIFDINRKKVIPYDVLPVIRQELEEKRKSWKRFLKSKEYTRLKESGDPFQIIPSRRPPERYEEYRKAIRGISACRWWAKCEYEIILRDWPCMMTDEKIDIHTQVINNLDLITSIIYEEDEDRRKRTMLRELRENVRSAKKLLNRELMAMPPVVE